MRFSFLLLIIISSFSLKAQLAQEQLDTCKVFTSLEEALINPDQVYKLDLKKKKLTEFPLDVLKLINLQVLSFDKNRLTSIPLELGKLSNLQELQLSRNDFVEFPDVICQLPGLKRLVLNQNMIQAIPACIAQCKQIEYIDMYSNDLAIYPIELKELKNLKEFDLRVIQLSREEQHKISRWLPNTKLHFSPSCDCAD